MFTLLFLLAVLSNATRECCPTMFENKNVCVNMGTKKLSSGVTVCCPSDDPRKMSLVTDGETCFCENEQACDGSKPFADHSPGTLHRPKSGWLFVLLCVVALVIVAPSSHWPQDLAALCDSSII
eukprot:gb/GEZN01016198.1/.p1 GENE.gb/GEZN01016198.1/~~gb/GEZN01016198.1/.p1  ORF type:complete len:124 (+),score=10.16 gb/GEZN01016198.1/:109-480(+)